MHLVNSAFLGVSSGSLRRALELLGIEGLKEIVDSQAALFTAPPAGQVATCENAQRHAELRLKLVRELFHERQGRELGEELVMAVLLCDVERFVVPTRDGVTTLSQRAAVSGLGSWLLDMWNLPAAIVETAAGLCCPDAMPLRHVARDFLALVHAADVFAWQRVEGDDTRRIDPAWSDELKMEPEVLWEHLERIAGR